MVDDCRLMLGQVSESAKAARVASVVVGGNCAGELFLEWPVRGWRIAARVV